MPGVGRVIDLFIVLAQRCPPSIMKKLKQIIQTVKASTDDSPGLNDLLWQLICYSPKMPVRMRQQQLLDESEKHSLYALDEFFVKRDLLFNTFKWGSGSKRIIITHGWGSKAADFSELITALREIPDTEIIAFDAPGNGSSEGELSNLELYVHAVAAIIKHYGKPDVMIGHSLGGITNVMAVAQTGVPRRYSLASRRLSGCRSTLRPACRQQGCRRHRSKFILKVLKKW